MGVASNVVRSGISMVISTFRFPEVQYAVSWQRDYRSTGAPCQGTFRLRLSKDTFRLL